MNYKALICDVDDTLVGKKYNDLPSPRVTTALREASKKLHVGVATARSSLSLAHILANLNLQGPAIINGGAQVMDIATQNILWERLLNKETVKIIARTLEKRHISYFINDNNQERTISHLKTLTKPIDIEVHPLPPNEAENIITHFSHLPSIAIHKIPTWKSDKIILHITHAEASKQHALLEVAKILQIDTHEMIAVGDGYNDFPLLMACGLKVAMGNAVDDLKAIADYIAPTVDEDGVADVIERFILCD